LRRVSSVGSINSLNLRGWQFMTNDQADLNELADSESGNP
jgi:hypothetical protein